MAETHVTHQQAAEAAHQIVTALEHATEQIRGLDQYSDVVPTLERATQQIQSDISQSDDPVWIARKVSEHCLGKDGLFPTLHRQVMEVWTSDPDARSSHEGMFFGDDGLFTHLYQHLGELHRYALDDIEHRASHP